MNLMKKVKWKRLVSIKQRKKVKKSTTKMIKLELMWKEFETLPVFVLLLCVGRCDLSPTLIALIISRLHLTCYFPKSSHDNSFPQYMSKPNLAITFLYVTGHDFSSKEMGEID